MAKVESDVAFSVEIEEPKKYGVYILNDNYTTMDFVVEILIKLFQKSLDEAYRIMMDTHEKGRGLCGVYIKEVAETKVEQVVDTAKINGFPLRAVSEEIE
jgi:ATP-dependent Clp protease adaptor protein ClpS